MNKQAQHKPRTTLGGFPFIPSREKDNGQMASNANGSNVLSDKNEPVIGEDELLQFWWRY